MAYAAKYLGIKVEKESIEQVELYSRRKQFLEGRLLQRRSQQLRLSPAAKSLRDILLSRQTLKKHSESVAAETELANIQTAVVAVMVDNRIASLPNPVGVATNDMAAFPDAISAVTVEKLNDPNGTAYQAGDKDGFVLYQHDIIADNVATGLVNYVATQTTKGTYAVTADGTVTQVTTGYE